MALSNYKINNYQLRKEADANRVDDEQNRIKFASSISRELQPWPSDVNKPSELYKLVQTNSQHPPLMQTKSWNLAVPFREQRYSHTPSESIANNYSPNAIDLKIKNLPAKKFKKLKTTHSMSQQNEPNVRLKNAKFQNSFDNQLEIERYPPSRAQSPFEQLESMDAIEKELSKFIKDPNPSDLERYYFYIEKGTELEMISSLPSNQFELFYRFVSPSLRNHSVHDLLNELSDEIKSDYVHSMRKSIVDYVLMNNDERKRLKIEFIPKMFNLKTIRAPVPWHDEYSDSSEWIHTNLHNVNKINSHLHDLWTNE